MRGTTMIYKELSCTKCGEVMIIPRLRSRNRAYGHIKTMWCYKCKDKTDFIEQDNYGIHNKF